MSGRNWRAIGRSGEPYPAWLAAVRSASGVYAIREIGIFTNRVLYVGESHSGHLLKTLSRHFQAWSRGKGWWDGMFGTTDPGRTYDRSAVEVCVQACAASRAVALQDAWIRELRPRDNIQGAEEEVPF